MQLRVLGNSGGSAPGVQLSSYLIDGVLAVDAGSLTTTLSLEEQLRVEAVLVTHGHMDHICTLPYFLIHRYGREVPPLSVVADAFTHETLREHIFNGRVWVTHEIANGGDPARIPLLPLEAGGHLRLLERYDVRAIGLEHEVPSQAYWIASEEAQVIVCGDTTTTDELWKTANGIEGLGAILVECSWTDDELARVTGHMSTGLLLADLEKLTADVPVYVTHRKPGYVTAIETELRAAGDDRLRYVTDGDVIEL